MEMAADLPRASSVLPEDLTVEILSWLPVKTLMRFRCVSKTWNSLIFHPTFVNLHLRRCTKNTHVLLKFRDINTHDYDTYPWAAFCSIRCLLENPSSTIDDSCHYFNNRYSFIGSCNGLVCLHDYSVKEHSIRFWNPATRIMSEESPHLLLHSDSYNAGPNSVDWLFGFGYDDWSNTYKVVLILSNIKTHEMEVKVHCMSDTCWRNILTCPDFLIMGQVGRFVTGTLNWMTCRSSVHELVIFSYDLRNETCRYLPVPDGCFELLGLSLAHPYLGVLKGCLCVSLYQKRTHFVVWVMREFGVETSWTQLLNISYEHLHIHCSIPTVVVLCMSEDEDVFLLANYRSAEFILYKKRDNRIDRIRGFNNCYKSWVLSYDYVQSLVLPY